jgi:hypothetical protein
MDYAVEFGDIAQVRVHSHSEAGAFVRRI